MTRATSPAVLYLRISPALRDGLRAASDEAGLSLNAYAAQVLAAAAGHKAAFRDAAVPTEIAEAEQTAGLRDLRRKPDGYPIAFRERDRHVAALHAWVETLRKTMNFADLMKLKYRIDIECPWFYVEWRELDGPLLPPEPEA